MNWTLGAILKLRVNENESVFTPFVGKMYNLNARLTTNVRTVVEMEALHFALLIFTSKALPGYFQRTAEYRGRISEGIFLLLSSVCANGKKGELTLKYSHNAYQYRLLLTYVNMNEEVFVAGELHDF